MAKKTPARRRQRQEAAQDQHRFSDEKYDGVLFSATFDYNELCLVRASELLAPRTKNVLLGITFVALLGIVLVALIGGTESTTVPLVVLFAVCMVLMSVTSSWQRIQARYARRTSLAVEPGGRRTHVVVCPDALHVEDDKGGEASYPLSDLRVVYDTSDFLVAGFGGRRYAYVPRAALSENRYRELCRFLHDEASD